MQILKKISDSSNLKILLPAVVALGLGGAYFIHRNSSANQQIQSQIVQDPLSEIGQNKFLSQKAADLRYLQVEQGSIHYYVDLLLKKGTHFAGTSTIKLSLKHTNHDLFVDYRGQKIVTLIVNNQKIENPNWNSLFIRIPKEHLSTTQRNTIHIQYETNYAGDGCGLHSYVDPQDKKQYLYSQGESYFCNRFFPCLDQPDLKATLQFSVVSPKEWAVISNEDPETTFNYQFTQVKDALVNRLPELLINHQYKPEHEQDGYKFQIFGTTKKLPTYLFAIIAGEYWSVKQEQFHNNISQTIYCRESLKEYMLKMKDFIFEVTTESMKFYENFFKVPYQFTKYDSIFVAEYNWGAMENPGCVTFNDLYVFREEKPIQSYTQLANTIAHEMAHHWFGDYVTMKWWNDLWLNESYADFISFYCLSNITIKTRELANIPNAFNQRKAWGYREDQMLTTHPIAGDVLNTEVAENIFDGITYSKGASCMKQLLCIMGAQAFGEACGKYFQTFAWRNAVLQDLIDHLQEKYNNPAFTLQQWKEQWIEKAGLNEIEAKWNPASREENSQLVIHQRPALQEFPTLRVHKIKIAFFEEDGNITAIDALIENKSQTVITYNASHHSFRAVLLNYEDQSFVKVLLDENSQKYFAQHLHLVDDLLTRTLIYRAMFDTVRDGKLSSEEYLEFLLNALLREKSDDIISSQLTYLSSAVGAMTPTKFKNTLARRVFAFLVDQVRQLIKAGADKYKNRLIILRQNILVFTYDHSSLDKLINWWRDGDEDLKGLEVTLDSKWTIVDLVHKYKHYDNQEALRKQLLEEQLNVDKSDKASKVQLKIQAYLVSSDKRQELWAYFCDKNNKESTKNLAEQMNGFNNNERYGELVDYHDKFFQVINEIFDTRSTDHAKTFYNHLFPETDDLTTLIHYIEQTIKRTPESKATLRKYLLMSLEASKRQLMQFECFLNRAPLARQ